MLKKVFHFTKAPWRVGAIKTDRECNEWAVHKVNDTELPDQVRSQCPEIRTKEIQNTAMELL